MSVGHLVLLVGVFWLRKRHDDLPYESYKRFDAWTKLSLCYFAWNIPQTSLTWWS